MNNSRLDLTIDGALIGQVLNLIRLSRRGLGRHCGSYLKLFSSLYSMLPSAKTSLIKGGLSPQSSAYATIGCFLGGVIGIQAVSHLLHHYIPSHVVDCDHTHDDEHDEGTHEHENGISNQNHSHLDEQSPLLSNRDRFLKQDGQRLVRSSTGELLHENSKPGQAVKSGMRPSLQSRVSKLVTGVKSACDADGPCYGYSDPCAPECFKAVNRVSGIRPVTSAPAQPKILRTASTPYCNMEHPPSRDGDEEYDNGYLSAPSTLSRSSSYSTRVLIHPQGSRHLYSSSHSNSSSSTIDLESNQKATATANDLTQPPHHHHVPTNAFLSIGLQTSLAIALHKLPEGFITFATNHANPQLGFSVFMALFIHNITEGFAMALPLYLAIGSRWKSMFWSSLLGGISQPVGAGVAALWFKLAGRTDGLTPGERVYGCMFAITAGIMASVALQLFSESLALTHNRHLCLAFAFIGMGILGFSFALTAS
ncbi:MAG: hypothetical protein Q9214_006128 [Letrouitia sp. 1 TL-2023]